MAKNTITLERYNEIKPHVGNPKDDSKNMKKFGVGQTVVRDIRNTKNYVEYRKRGATYRKAVKQAKAVPRKSPIVVKSLQVEPKVNKKHNVVDILVIAVIIALFIAVLAFGGK